VVGVGKEFKGGPRAEALADGLEEIELCEFVAGALENLSRRLVDRAAHSGARPRPAGDGT